MAASSAVKHIRNYASAGLLGSLAGVVTLPILTRNLTVGEYGAIGLVTSSLALFVAFGKLGLQHSIIRFFAQAEAGKSWFNLGQLNSTVGAVFMLLAITATLLWIVTGSYILPLFLQHDDISNLFLVASGIVFLRLLGSAVTNFLRAQQRSGIVGVSQIINKYFYLLMLVALLFTHYLHPYYLLFCLFLAEIVGVVVTLKYFVPHFSFSFSQISPPLAKAMLIYGMPLMAIETMNLVLRLSDRYIIEALLGVEALGMYSASYNLTSYLDLIFLTAIMQAIKPHYVNLWEHQGAEQTQNFLAKGFHIYLVIGIPFITVFSLVCPHLVELLAGELYAPGTVIVPYVAISFLLDGAMIFLAAGLFIKKETNALMAWSAVATISNLALNYLLVPMFGIVAAAIVTIFSFLIFMLGVSQRAFRHIAFPLELKTPVYSAIISLVVFAFFCQFDLGNQLLNILVKGSLSSIVLFSGALLIDEPARHWVINSVRPLLAKLT